MEFLVDTNVISELMRREPDARVKAWAAAHDGFHVSVISLEELVFGLTRKALVMKRQWLEEFLARHCQVLPLTANIARNAGALRGKFAAQGIIREAADMLIAATALSHKLTLVTRDTSDFAGCGVELINPFHDP